jgi:cytochrome c oxidase subunit 4
VSDAHDSHGGHEHGHGHDHAHAPAAAHDEAEHHHDPSQGLPFNPFVIFAVLVVLTAVSWLADKMQASLSVMSISVIVMFVSMCKASLVIAFFMHFKYEGKWKYVLTIPPLIMAVWVMVSLIPDVGRRLKREDPWKYPALPAAAAPAAPGHGAPAGGTGH